MMLESVRHSCPLLSRILVRQLLTILLFIHSLHDLELLGPLHSVVDRTCTPEAPLILPGATATRPAVSINPTTELVYSASGEPSQPDAVCLVTTASQHRRALPTHQLTYHRVTVCRCII